MNRTFKILFNRARGTMMVANEATRSVSKGTTKAVVAVAVASALSFGSAAFAADYTGKDLNLENNSSVSNAHLSSTGGNAVVSIGDNFSDNKAVYANTSGLPGALGIATSNADANVDNATFSNNAISDGASSANGTYGAAIGVAQGNLTVTNSVFTGNASTSYRQAQGSAIYQSTGSINVSGSEFTNNSAQAADDSSGNATGGAISLWGVGGSIEGSQFKQNTVQATETAYGGALYLRDGTWGGKKDLTVSVRDSSFTNNQAIGLSGLGGAIYAKSTYDGENRALLNLDLNDVTFSGNSATHMGGAVFVEGEGKLTMTDVTFENNTANYGSALMVYGNKRNESHLSTAHTAIVEANNVHYLNNTASGYATLFLYTKTDYIQNGGSFVGNKTIDNSAKTANSAYLGSVFVKGANAVFNDVLFQNNVVESTNNVAAGGAVYVDIVSNSTAGVVGGSVTFNITKDMLYSGNNVIGTEDVTDTYGYLTSTAGGFLFLDRGTSAIFNISENATLTIGEESATGSMDSIASAWGKTAEDSAALITKTGAGTLVLNGDMNKYYGTVSVEAGRMEVSKDWTINNTVNINGGTLALASFDFDKQPDPSEVKGSIVVGENGTLETSSSQIFTTALNAEGSNTAAGALKYTNGEVSVHGTIALNDALYNLDYAQSAGSLVQNGTVIMLGDLINAGEIDNELTLDEVENVGENVELNNVTISSEDQNIQIGGTEQSGVAYRENSLAVGALSLGTADTVTVTGGKTLSLAGNGGDIIASSDAQSTTVNVTDGATLALGGAAAKGGTISGTVNIDATSSMSVSGDADFTVNTVKGDGTVLVGNDQQAGTLVVNSLKDMTGMIFIDPDWIEGANTIENASALIVNNNEEALNAYVVAARNSVGISGSSKDEAVSAFNKLATAHNLSWKDDVTAAFYAGSTVDLGTTGSILIDGSLTDITQAPERIDQTVTVADKGMFIVNQPTTETAIVTGNVQINAGGYLGVVNAKEGTFTLASGEVTNNGIVVTDNPFLQGSINGNKVTNSLDTASGSAALASTGIQAMTRRADMVFAQTIADRTSIDQELGKGLNLWVDVSGETYKADKFDNGGEFEADMGYGAFGADIALTDTWTVGGALQYGTGSLRSDVSSIKNDIKNYGVGLYVSKSFGAAKVVGEVAYIAAENDITASQSALNQDVDTTMYSAGLRAQYQLTAGQFQFVPSIGVRVSRLETDAMNIGSVDIDDQDQTLVQVPIALRINGYNQNVQGWNMAPSFRIAYVPTFGDKEIDVLGYDQDVIDTNPVQVDFGVRAGKDNMLFNAHMTMGAGEHGSSSIGAKLGMKYVF